MSFVKILIPALVITSSICVDAAKLYNADATLEDVQLGGLSCLLLMTFVGLAIYFASYRLGLLKGIVIQGVHVNTVADAIAAEVDQKAKEKLSGVKQMDLSGAKMPFGLDLEASAVLDAVLDNSSFQDLSQKWQSGCKEVLLALNGSGSTSARDMLDNRDCQEKNGLLADCDDADVSNDQSWVSEKLDFSQCPAPPTADLFKPLDASEDIQVLPVCETFRMDTSDDEPCDNSLLSTSVLEECEDSLISSSVPEDSLI